MAFFVALYSYKGGVGRTLALANLGYSLAARGKRVILVDMDLEAPALHDFPELALRGKKEKRGIADYAASYARRGQCPAIKRYVYACRKSPGRGKLWLMPAGRFGDNYQQTLGRLNWRRLHPKKGTQPFIEGFREALVEAYKPHYVLIDARTGLSDVGGISTHHLADMVVVVFNLTRGCIEGSVRTYRSFTAESSRVRALQLVANPVPPLASDGDSIIEKRLRQASELMPLGTSFGREIIRIDYDPSMVLAEDLAVRKPETFRAAACYERLREAVQRANPTEVFPIVEEAHNRRSKGRLGEGLKLLEDFVERNPDNAEGYLELGSLLLESDRPKGAVNYFRLGSKIAPGMPILHQRLGEALLATGSEAEAAVSLETAVDSGARGPEVFEALAVAYSKQGETAKQMEARRRAFTATLGDVHRSSSGRGKKPKKLRAEFISILGRNPPYMAFQPDAFWDLLMGSLTFSPEEKFKATHRLLEGQLNASQTAGLVRILEDEARRWLEALGPSADIFRSRVAKKSMDVSDLDSLLALREGDVGDSALLIFAALGQQKDPEKQVSLLSEADKVDPANHIVLFEWGTALSNCADLEEGDQHRDLLQQACGRFEEAVKHKPDKHDALINWGTALGRLSDLEEGDQRLNLLQQACGRFRKAVELKLDNYEAHYNWGKALGELADLEEGDQRQDLLQQACGRYLEAVKYKPDADEALNNWGSALIKLADLEEGEPQQALLEQACGRYKEAVEHKPDEYVALNNWGITLKKLAYLEEGDQRQDLLQQACGRFEEAVKHKPGEYGALNSWAAALLHLASTAQGKARQGFLAEAVGRATEASAIKAHAGDYNLACAMSLLGQFNEASRRLAKELIHRPAMRTHALEDADFKLLWEEHPTLHAAVRRSLDAGSDLGSIKNWIAEHKADD